ncbi:hypothetical protein C8F01DRAFT_1250375 [Mycena amicta]|nr:hypothetical protein C8F01DRAFT_1250375 [Mycena amicta]
MVTPTLAPELWDQIIDELRTDRHALRAMGLVCRAYVPRSRSHLFERFSSSRNWTLRWKSLAECLSSPLCTILAAVQHLDLQYHLNRRGLQFATLNRPSIAIANLAPHLSQLSNVRSLTISELCWPLLESNAAFTSSVKEFTLVLDLYTRLTPSTTRRLTRCFPNLERVRFGCASPFLDPYTPAHEIVGPGDSTNGAKLRHLSLRRYEHGILGGFLQPPAPPFGVHITHLTIDSLAPDDLQHVCSYISHLDSLEFLSVAMPRPVDERSLPALLPGNIISKLATLRLKFNYSNHAHDFFRFGTLCQWPSQSVGLPAKQILLQVVVASQFKKPAKHVPTAQPSCTVTSRPRNIIVRNAKIVAILDWEFGGWYPEYWEYTTAWYANRRMANRRWLEFQELFLKEVFSQHYPEELIAERCLSYLFIRFW